MSKRSNPTYKSQQFSGKVIVENEKNIIKLNYPQGYRHFVHSVCRPGDNVSLYITNKKPKRSTLQNNYYWLYLSLISLSSGFTPNELHDWAKEKFLTTQGIKEVFGEKVRKVKSTTDLTIGEFCEYICLIEDETEIPTPDSGPFLKALTHDEFDKLKYGQRMAYLRMSPKLVIKKDESNSQKTS